MWYFIQGSSVNRTFSGNEAFNQTDWSAIANGSLTMITFYANDSLGNEASQSVSIYVDKLGPSITINSPSDNDIFNATAPVFDVSITDGNLDTMWYNIAGSGKNRTFSGNEAFNQTDWTGITNGTVTIITFYANDSLGNEASQSVSIYVDKLAPSITINSPSDNDIFNATAPLFDVSITDGNFDSMWYFIEGSSVNRTFSGNEAFNQTDWSAIANGSLTMITFYANDSLGNVASQSVSIYVDKLGPSITINSPSDNDIFNATAPVFDVSITDGNLDSMWYFIEGSSVNRTFSGNEAFNQTDWDGIANGTLTTITFYANDSLGNEASQSISIYVDKLGPSITINSPSNNDIFNATAPVFDVSITDGNLDTMWYYIEGSLVNRTFSGNEAFNQTDWDGITNGTLTMITFYANDSLGNEASQSVSIYVGNTGPSITINSPIENAAFNVIAPFFNVTIYAVNFNVSWYTIDGGTTNTTFIGNNTLIQIDQLNWTNHPGVSVTLIFYVNDTFGNIGTAQISIIKDTVDPLIANEENDGPVLVNTGLLSITCNVTDNNALSATDPVQIQIWSPSDTLLLDWTSMTSYGVSGYRYIWPVGANLVGTGYYYRIRANDSLNNVIITINYTFNILAPIVPPVGDLVDPIITNIMDDGAILVNSGSLSITCNVTDNSALSEIDPVQIQIRDPSDSLILDWTSMNSYGTTGNRYIWDVGTSPIGTGYYYRIRANDSSNNVVITSNNYFDIVIGIMSYKIINLTQFDQPIILNGTIYEVYLGENITICLTLLDFHTNEIITGAFGNLTFNNKSFTYSDVNNDGLYFWEINTNQLSVGRYNLSITFSDINHQQITIELIFDMNKSEGNGTGGDGDDKGSTLQLNLNFPFFIFFGVFAVIVIIVMKKKLTQNTRALIIKRNSDDVVGFLSEILGKYHILYDIIDFSKKIEVPKINNYDLIVVLDCPDIVKDFSKIPYLFRNFNNKINNLLVRVRQCVKLALEKKIPVYGICRGVQILADAYEDEIYDSPINEVGFKNDSNSYRIELTEKGLENALFKDINGNFIIVELYCENSKLTDYMSLIGTGEYGQNQIIKLGEFSYGFESHFKLTDDMLFNILNYAPKLEGHENKFILIDFEDVEKNYIERGKQTFTNYLKMVHIIDQ
ncbi:hypothetical protein LCGC14_0784240, partial [marine sediment metagenome]